MISKSDLFFQLRDLLRSAHDLLLHNWFFLFEFRQLFLQMIVFVLLHDDLIWKRIEVCHNQWIYYFNILIIDSLQVVVHHGNILPQTFYLFLVFPQDRVGSLYCILMIHVIIDNALLQSFLYSALHFDLIDLPMIYQVINSKFIKNH